jgi:hypothetical protein
LERLHYVAEIHPVFDECGPAQCVEAAEFNRDQEALQLSFLGLLSH